MDDKPAEQMTDEELNAKVNPEAEAEAPESTEEETPEPQEEAQEESTEEAPEEQPPSRREQLRVQQLLQRYGTPPKSTPKVGGMDYSKELTIDSEETVKQLETDRQLVSDEAYNQGIQRAELIGWKTALKMEAPQVEKEYPFLNPKDTANFRPAAADAMNQKYLRFIGYDPGDANRSESVRIPDVSYSEFVSAEMEFVNDLASQQTAESTKNIAKQTAQTGLRPDGSSAKRLNLNKNPHDMSTEELYAAIGQTPPKK